MAGPYIYLEMEGRGPTNEVNATMHRTCTASQRSFKFMTSFAQFLTRASNIHYQCRDPNSSHAPYNRNLRTPCFRSVLLPRLFRNPSTMIMIDIRPCVRVRAAPLLTCIMPVATADVRKVTKQGVKLRVTTTRRCMMMPVSVCKMHPCRVERGVVGIAYLEEWKVGFASLEQPSPPQLSLRRARRTKAVGWTSRWMTD